MSKPKKEVEVVVFNNPWKGKDKNSGSGIKEDNQKANLKPGQAGPSTARPMFDQKKAKYDIRKLGIHGMDRSNKQNAMADLLIELGADPPRNKVYHIKEYQQMAKKKREEEEKLQIMTDGKKKKKPMAKKKREEEEKLQIMTDGKKKKKPKEKRKRDKDDLLNYVDGQTGFYKDGVQFVKKKKR
ncbi:hypothetical protein EGW08_000562 [Elysia chlorotica]|uniref:Uncharacterized protein n=1 Tax=Elysia chlorotica TaxID=188477 RepID=A0A433UD47_ELYCH|nr:hypothetical protein EGW08_000562 [Elysia chlorotica]